MDKLHEIVGKISAYSSAVKDEEKQSKLLRTLLESFATLAMLAPTHYMTFDRLVAAVEVELSGRK